MRNKLSILLLISPFIIYSQSHTYPVVETGVTDFYSATTIIDAPAEGEAFYGQDAQYTGNLPSYKDNGDGTVTDQVTGLMWQQVMGPKTTFADAQKIADTLALAGYNDWRIPTIKELYSLILFTGSVKSAEPKDFFIDTSYFEQPLGDESAGERLIDAQTWSSTHYTSTTMRGDSTIFGVNFLDGRIKGYPKYYPGTNNTEPRSMYFRFVRGNADYGKNNFVDNKDGTISDLATGLMWQAEDDGNSRDWEGAIAYSENLELAGYDDWRLPNAKELQSIVDYSRCPDKTQSAAIDPIFTTTAITDPAGNTGQYPYFWTGTTHLDGVNPYSGAVYIAFGEAQGMMGDLLLDVHGAGAQRSDPKAGNREDYPQYFGPQGDLRYVFNYVRAVRDIDTETSNSPGKAASNAKVYPNPAGSSLYISISGETGTFPFRITDSTGRVFDTDELDLSESIALNIGHYPPGIYHLHIWFEKEIGSFRFVKL